MTRQDVAVLGAFLVMQVLMAPVQHHVFESSCLGQRASEEDGENELRARRFATLADGPLYRNRWFLYPRVLIMLVIAATAYLRRRLPDQRKRVLLANFATTWVCHLVVNLRMLYLGVQQPVLSPAMIACQACLGLSCHLMLPLNPHRRRDDVVPVSGCRDPNLGLGEALLLPMRCFSDVGHPKPLPQSLG